MSDKNKNNKNRAISAWRALYYAELITEEESNKIKARIHKLKD